MSYTEMDFIQFHRIVHAHSMSQANCWYSLGSCDCGCFGPGACYGGVLEVGIVEKSPLTLKLVDRNQTIFVGEGGIYIIPPGIRVNISAEHPDEHKRSSVEFLIDCILRPIDREELTPSDFARVRGQTVLLPFALPASPDTDALASLIRQLAHDGILMTEKSYFEECQSFMQIISSISALLRDRAMPAAVSPAHRRYCQLVREYISQHIDQHISLEEIAAHVGLNKNYLANVFTACEHMRLSEYINRVKLNHMMELIVKYGHSIRQAGEAVGFTDVNYVSRIFKKYHGVTISEYRRLLEEQRPL